MVKIAKISALICSAALMVSTAYAQINRPVSGVVAATTAPVEISFTDAQGDLIGRTAGIGDPIYLNDEITTGASDSLQVLLSDQTVFSIGPNSVLVFDEFIYDPSSDGADASLVASVKKGSFKFISGKVSKLNPGAMKRKLPNASASIRGTTVAGRVDEDGESDILLLSGAIEVARASLPNPIELLTPGWGTSISAGGTIAPPTEFTPEQIDTLVSAVEFVLSPSTSTAQSEEGETSGESGTSAASTVPALTPETAETLEDIVTLVADNVETDAEGSISISNLASYLQTSGLAAQLGIPEEDLNAEGFENVNIEAGLINFLLSGGEPLWLTAKTVNGSLKIGNPPPSSSGSNYQTEQYQLYQNNYADIVSSVYAGAVNFTRTGLALNAGTLYAGISDDLGGGERSFTSAGNGSGNVSYNVTLDYDAADITGTVAIDTLQLNGQNYGQVGGNINFTSLANDAMLNDLTLYQDSNLTSGGEVAAMRFTGQFGSITDGLNVINGNLAGFAMEVSSTSNPEYADVTDLLPDGSTGIAYLSTFGEAIHFDSTWTDNGDGTFTAGGITHALTGAVPTDINGSAATVTLNTLQDTSQFTEVQAGISYQQNGTSNMIYLRNAQTIPTLSAEQYTAGTIEE